MRDRILAGDTRKPVLSEVEWMRRGNVTLIIPNSHEAEIGVGFLTRLLRQNWLHTRRVAGLSRMYVLIKTDILLSFVNF